MLLLSQDIHKGAVTKPIDSVGFHRLLLDCHQPNPTYWLNCCNVNHWPSPLQSPNQNRHNRQECSSS